MLPTRSNCNLCFRPSTKIGFRFSFLSPLIFFLVSSSTASAIDKTIVDLQPNKRSELLDVKINEKFGFVRLTNLNTDHNVWYILEVTWPGEKKSHKFHLENPEPETRSIKIDKSYITGVIIEDKAGAITCDLWSTTESELRHSQTTKKTFVPICDSKILVRNKTEGRETTKEFVADFFRKNIWGGEKITGLVKDYLYKDKFLVTSDSTTQKQALPPLQFAEATQPMEAKIREEDKLTSLQAKDLAIKLAEGAPEQLLVGRWYPSKISEHVMISIIQPTMVAEDILKTFPKRVRKLDPTEKKALIYMVGYNLRHFKLGYALGTKHPTPEWSDRAPTKIKNEEPGPDGFGTYEPLEMVGKMNPSEAQTVISTFTGGFKRTHGAFKWGHLSTINKASHYGFMVNGVVFSSLNPELATFIIYRDGSIALKTWTTEENKNLADILHARQNGVPIIETDPNTKEGVPGEYVGNWSLGNWSGSAQSQQRALRAAVCVQEHNGDRFMLYGYFSSVTPNAMARVFQAYGCKYAMHLDMNALEHTYLALYNKKGKEFQIQHLIAGMNVLDRKTANTTVPRFIGTADNRDFFYVMEKH